MSGLLIFFIVLALPAIFGVFMFNQLVTLKHNVGKAWSNIDILLKQRHDELPKLVETCKQYMKFEQETLGIRFIWHLDRHLWGGRWQRPYIDRSRRR